MRKIAIVSCLGMLFEISLAQANYEDPETGLMPGQTELAAPLSVTDNAPSLTAELEIEPSTSSVAVSDEIPAEPPRLKVREPSYERLTTTPEHQEELVSQGKALQVIEVVVESPEPTPALGPEDLEQTQLNASNQSQENSLTELSENNPKSQSRKCLQEGKGFFAATGCLVGKFGASIEKTPAVAKEVWSGVVTSSQKVGEALKENTQERKEPAPIVELTPKQLSN